MIGSRPLILWSFLVLLTIGEAEKIRRNDFDDFELDIRNGSVKSVKKLRNSNELDSSNLGISEIEDRAFENVSVRILNLESNKILGLGPETFFGIGAVLEELNLGSNEIRNIDAAFLGLDNVKLLNLSNNPIEFLVTGELQGVPTTAYILVKGNKLTGFSTGLFEKSKLESSKQDSQSSDRGIAENTRNSLADEFEDLAELFHLALNGKTIPRDRYSSGLARVIRPIICIENSMLKNVSSIETNETLPNNCMDFDILGGIKYLDLQDLEIESIAEGWYQIEQSPVGIIDFQNNSLTELSPELLNNLPASLKVVDLSKNLIVRIAKKDFRNVRIRALSLQDNLIETIEEGAFSFFGELKVLFLNGNQISDISFAASLPVSLNHLHLNHNKIRQIPAGIFAKQEKLTQLYLQNNSVAEIEENAFEGSSSLEVLNLACNHMTKIAVTFPYNLKHLDLSANHIYQIENGSFVNSPKKILKLNTNNIPKISLTYFDIASLEELDLANNQISEITTDAFHGIPNIVRLNLKANLISEIRPGTVKLLNSLIRLDISQNPIVNLRNGAFFGLPKTSRCLVDVDNNKLEIIQGRILENF